MKWGAILLLSGVLAFSAQGYPLDAGEQTGMERLIGYRLIQQGQSPGKKLFPGALLSCSQVKLRLTGYQQLELNNVDSVLTDEILAFLGEEKDLYSFSILDVSLPDRPSFAEHQGVLNFNPGSLGKLLIAVALFQALADRYPDNIDARQQILQQRRIIADQFIHSDYHKVPFWDGDQKRMDYRPIQIGDAGNLYTWLDWMFSPSSNAAAAIVLREYLLLVHFQQDYPVEQAIADEFIQNTSRSKLMKLLIKSLHEPMRRNGFDPDQLRQGGFFTRRGKQLIPGGSSRGNTRSFLTLLLRIEQGRLIDPFSSLEIKRLLYMTEKRIRYASHPALKHAAVYFKSGSLYSCQPEEGFSCKKYMGNKKNLLNSVAIVEEGEGDSRLHYMVVVTSNVLRVNSAVAHQTLAMRIHRLLQAKHRKRLRLQDSEG